MMYPFMTLNDGTEIVHSEILDPATDKVRVIIEKPIWQGFKSAECYLPKYEWVNIAGYSPSEIKKLTKFLETVAHIVIRLAREGGFEGGVTEDASAL